MQAYPFDCPYCNRPTTITDKDYHRQQVVSNVYGSDTNRVANYIETIVCPNPKCRRTTLSLEMWPVEWSGATYRAIGDSPLLSWPLLPRSRARQYPAYVPTAIKEDYEEAHLIINQSPKASATLARRALQGIIRNFYGAPPGNLYDEINWAEKNGPMEPSLVRAVHAVRDVGNIGAHMSKDIDVIVPVDPGEADALLHLIELLIDETYVARQDRESKVNAVLEIAAQKKALKAHQPPKALPPTTK